MKEFIKNLFRDVIVNENYDEALILKYFSEKYIQTVNNETLNFEDFKKHIQKLKSKVVDQKVEFLNIVSDNNIIFTKHIVISTLLNGEVVKHKVFAEFVVDDNKVISCDELTILVEGNAKETHIGSEV